MLGLLLKVFGGLNRKRASALRCIAISQHAEAEARKAEGDVRVTSQQLEALGTKVFPSVIAAVVRVGSCGTCAVLSIASRVRQMARTRQSGLLISDASEEVKEMLRDTEVARMIREIDSSPHPHRALLDARSDPRVIRVIS